MMSVVHVERPPTAITTLHTLQPFQCPLDTLPMRCVASAMQGHCHNSRVVNIRVVRIGVLKGPATRAQIWPSFTPVGGAVKHLPLSKPAACVSSSGLLRIATDLEHGVDGQCRVPNWRQTGLAIDLILTLHQEPVDSLTAILALRMT